MFGGLSLGGAFVEISAPTAKLDTDLRAAETNFRAAVGRIGARSQVPLGVSVDRKEIAEKLKEAAVDAGKHVALSHAVGRLIPHAAHAAHPVEMGMAAVDMGAEKAAQVTIDVAQGTLKAGLSAAMATLRAAVRAMAKVAVLPLTVGHIGLKIGLGVAQALVLAKVKQMTGWSTVKLVVVYAGIKVGLKIAEAMVKAAVRTMARVAMIPVRLSLGGLRLTLGIAKGIVRSAMDTIKGMAHAATAAVSGVATGGLGLGLIGGLIGVPAAIAGTIKAASDLNETVSKVGFTFGDATKIVTDGADEMARRFGVPKREFLDGAASIGLIAKAAGLSNTESAKMSVRFAKLAADAASFYNIPVDEALEKIRSGLVGEAEPMRALGVLLDEDTVKARAMAMGLAEAGKKGGVLKESLSQGDKVLARAALMFDGMATASGDLERTADSLANRMRELWGRVQLVAESIGQYLLPAVQSLSAAFATMLSDLTDGIGGKAAVFEAWSQSLKAAADWVGVIYRNVGLVKANAKGLFSEAMGDLWKGFQSVFEYLVKWAKYLANVLGQSIEKAITKSLKGTIFSKGDYDQTIHYTPPTFHPPTVGQGPVAQGTLAQVRAGENAKALTDVLVRLDSQLMAVSAEIGRNVLAEQRRTNALRQSRMATLTSPETLRGFTVHPPGGFEEFAEQRAARERARLRPVRGEVGPPVPPEVRKKEAEKNALGFGLNKDLRDKQEGKDKGKDKVAEAVAAFAKIPGMLAGAMAGVAGAGPAAAVAAMAGQQAAQIASAIGFAVGNGTEKERKTAEFVGIADFAKQIQVSALDKDNLQKKAVDHLGAIRDAVTKRGGANQMIAVAAP